MRVADKKVTKKMGPESLKKIFIVPAYDILL